MEIVDYDYCHHLLSASDNLHNGSWVTRIGNVLFPKNMIGRDLTTQNRVTPPKMPKKIRDIIKMKVTYTQG